jgi:NAD(P)-dependent dehydrogenase (short-subunit alcohol dehydrogenase family)
MVKECNVTIWDEQVDLFAAGYAKYGRIDYVVISAGKLLLNAGAFVAI